jgi:hypothetical protein
VSCFVLPKISTDRQKKGIPVTKDSMESKS